MCNEEFCVEDYEDEFRDEYCNEYRCLNPAMYQSNPLRKDLEEYVNELFNDLYIFPERYAKSVEDIYTDLRRILSAN